MSGGTYPAFSPKCVRRYGLPGAKIALAGCPTREVREVLKEIVRAEGLPWSPLGGPFALDAEENRGSYLFAAVSESNVDEWIELGASRRFRGDPPLPLVAQAGPLRARPRPVPAWPGRPEAGDRQAARRRPQGRHAHADGRHPGGRPLGESRPGQASREGREFHARRSGRSRRQGHPHARAPAGLETFWSDMSTGNTLQIGDEIVAYTGISQEPPYGFTGCTRGQWGTKRSAHDQGATAQHLVATYCYLHPGRGQHAGGRTGRLHRQDVQHLRL